MNMMRYEPWTLMGQLQKEMSRLVDPRITNTTEDNVVTSDWTPAVDIKEETGRFVIAADVPGVDPKDVDVHMENGLLTLRGQRNFESTEEKNGYKRVERVHGSFYRRFSLPDTADAERISAKCSNGVLEIIIPKHEKVMPRKIAVES
ncbi:MAG: Hsp20/alpha crystallin family protein [Gammaproteobacteria bacterium]